MSRIDSHHRFLSSAAHSSWNPISLVQFWMCSSSISGSLPHALHILFLHLFFISVHHLPEYFIFRSFDKASSFCFLQLFPVLTGWCVSMSSTHWVVDWNISSQIRLWTLFSFLHLLASSSLLQDFKSLKMSTLGRFFDRFSEAPATSIAASIATSRRSGKAVS